MGYHAESMRVIPEQNKKKINEEYQHKLVFNNEYWHKLVFICQYTDMYIDMYIFYDSLDYIPHAQCQDSTFPR